MPYSRFEGAPSRPVPIPQEAYPLVTATVAGPMFEYTWGVRHATAASVDEATAKVMASDSYAAEVDSAGGLFHPGAAQVYAQRLA